MDNKDRTLFLSTLVVLGIAGRLLLTDLPNFAPVGALALFAGASFANKPIALALPLVVMFFTDLVIGFHSTFVFVYVAMAVYVAFGMIAGNRLNPLRLIPASLMGSVAFFVITNFGHFLAFYPMTWTGLAECYTLAIPFFDKTLFSDLVFSAVLFGALAFVQMVWPRLRPSCAVARAS